MINLRQRIKDEKNIDAKTVQGKAYWKANNTIKWLPDPTNDCTQPGLS